MGRPTALPKFPSTCDVYDGDITDSTQLIPHYTTKRLSDIACEVIGRTTAPYYVSTAYALNAAADAGGGWTYWPPITCIYFPIDTDIRGVGNYATWADSLIVDSIWRFVVYDTMPVALGFPGAFLCAFCIAAPGR